MQEIRIGKDGAGKRLDKFLCRYLSGAPASLLHKQLRKKNITLNGKKSDGSEILSEGDRICCWFSEETWEKFLHPALQTGTGEADVLIAQSVRFYREQTDVRILYEDEELLIADKPAGLLVQRAKPEDRSLNDWLIGHLTAGGQLKREELAVFRPSAMHRLDRNTSGIVLCAKTAAAARELAGMIRERRVGKFYHTLLWGEPAREGVLRGTVSKDHRKNTVVYTHMQAGDETVPDNGTSDPSAEDGGSPVETHYRVLKSFPEEGITLVEAELITGKPHQLRVQFAGIGHPIAGDRKYGGEQAKVPVPGLKAAHQLLHAARIVFPVTEGALQRVSGRTFTSRAPFLTGRYAL